VTGHAYSKQFDNCVNSKNRWNKLKRLGIGKCKQQTESEVDVELKNKKFLEVDVLEATCNPYLNTQPLCDNSFSFICIIQSDVLASTLHVKSDAVGLDNMSPKFVKLLLPLMLPHVTYIFNTAITTSSFPTIWKNAKIFPIPKLNNDYRPISMLPFLSKIFENLMSSQIQLYLANNSQLLKNNQDSVRKGVVLLQSLILLRL